MTKKKYIEGVWELENLKLGYYHAFEIMKNQNPKMTELEYLELIALPTATKGHNNYYATVEKAQNKLEIGKYVKWIEKHRVEIKKDRPKKKKEKSKETTEMRHAIILKTVADWKKTLTASKAVSQTAKDLGYSESHIYAVIKKS